MESKTIAALFLLSVNLLTLTQSSSEGSVNDLVVHLNHGSVRGKEMKGESGNTFYSFLGIPFAEPPVGHLRFKPPVPKRPWDEILDGTKEGSACPQVNFLLQTYTGQEDCLYLNVYTPQIPNGNYEKKLDVLFHVHGGGFIMGNGGSTMYGPGRLPINEFVYVSVNYRLTSLGFLSTNDAVSPGNYGLLDQIEALRWVRNNIDRFGGDPNRVTILGESAGGASIMYLVLSPLSTGLFNKAVSMSGSPLCPWALQKDPVYWAEKLATRVNCPTSNSEELVSCLRTKSAEELIKDSCIIDLGGSIAGFDFTPTIDGNFILDSPLNILKEGKYNKVPLVIGATKDEGNCWHLGRKNSPNDFTEEELLDALRICVDSRPNNDEEIKLVREKYFSTLQSYEENEVAKLVGKAVTHGAFEKGIYQTVKLLSEGGHPTFFYSYDFKNPISFGKVLYNKSGDYGVCHAEDLAMLFTGMISIPLINDDVKQMKAHYQRLLLNFIKYGNPTPQEDGAMPCEWPKVEPNKLHLYRINSECSVEIYDESKDELYDFWTKEIYPRYSKSKTPLKEEL